MYCGGGLQSPCPRSALDLPVGYPSRIACVTSSVHGAKKLILHCRENVSAFTRIYPQLTAFAGIYPHLPSFARIYLHLPQFTYTMSVAYLTPAQPSQSWALT